MTVMCIAELILWMAISFLFWRKKLYLRFKAMAAYLVLHLLATPFLIAAMVLQSRPGFEIYHSLLSWGQWGVFFASAGLLYFICVEIFCEALSGFPGLMHFGVVIFRWLSLAALVISLTSTPIIHITLQNLSLVCFSLARTISILELCLLAFLSLNLKGLRLSLRDAAFGLSLGFGLLSANDFVVSVMVTYFGAPSLLLNHLHEATTLASLSVWVVYFLLPVSERKPVVLPVNSALYRWNEIASALGHTGTQVAVQQPANSFFLSDVEKVVETVFKRTLIPGEADAPTKSGR